MVSKKMLLEWVSNLENCLYAQEERMDNLSARVRKLEAKPTMKIKVEKPEAKRGRGRPKGSKNKTKKQ